MPQFNYPQETSRRGGCKVSWLRYTRLADAKTASVVARKEARYMEGMGYDWGYQSPGSVQEITDKDGRKLFEVCIP
jgi:hypothetical protein